MTALFDHLTADELDALHAGTTLPRVTSHLATCNDCRALVALDTRLIADLGVLTRFEPASGFADQVMPHVNMPRPIAMPAVTSTDTERSRAARRRVVVGGLLTGGLVVGGVAWAVANPNAALGLTVPAFNDIGQALWLSVQAISANTVEQPWFAAVRDTLATPSRALPALVIAGGAYATVLLGLRRLLTRPATDAAW